MKAGDNKMETKTNSKKIWHIIFYTLLFSVAVGAASYFFLDTGAPTILPMIILPFPALLIKLFMQDRIKYPSYILTILGFAVSLIAIDLLVYYIREYGTDAMNFIIWKDLICLVCAMTMLESALLFPAFLIKDLPYSIMVVLLYACITILTFLVTSLGWWTTQVLYTITAEAILIVSAIVMAASIAATLLLHKKSTTSTAQSKAA